MKTQVVVPVGDKLVPFEELSKEEQEEIGRTVTTVLADSLMEAQGYKRVKDNEEAGG